VPVTISHTIILSFCFRKRPIPVRMKQRTPLPHLLTTPATSNTLDTQLVKEANTSLAYNCLQLTTTVQNYLQLPINIYNCLQLLFKCLHLPTTTNCLLLPTTANNHLKLPLAHNKCLQLPTTVHNYL